MRKAILGVLLLCFGIASVAAADPVTLTSGQVVVYADGSLITFLGSGNGFQASGSGAGTGSGTGFNVGDTVDLSRQVLFTPTLMDHGSVTVGGVTQQGYLKGSLQVSATPFVVATAGSQTFTTPFTMNGLLQFFALPGDPSPLLTQQVTAAGTASLGARDIGLGHFIADSGLFLTFEAPSAATPEPASLLLLGTGVAAVWRSRRLRGAAR